MLARRIHGRNADQIGRELDDLVRGAIDFGKNALDGLHGGFGVYNIAIMRLDTDMAEGAGRPLLRRVGCSLRRGNGDLR